MPETNSFHILSKTLHWAVAVLILGLLSVGFFMASMDFSPLKLQIYGMHKSFGLVVLALGIVRLAWRFIHPPPPSLETHQPWEKALSHLIHFLLYGIIFVMPLSGWVMSSAGDFPVHFFGLFEVPDIASKDEDLFKLTRGLHTLIAYAIFGAVGLHMAGALKHHFIDKDATLQRMTCSAVGFIGGALTTLFFGGMLGLAFLLAVVSPEEQGHTDVQAGEAAVSAEVPQEPGGWLIIPEESHIQFTATQYGQDFAGEFSRFDGFIVFDPDNLAGGHVRIEIHTGSISTGSADRDSQALGGDWFDVSSYPVAVFESTQFEHVEANQYVATGTLTIRNQIQPVVLPFSLEINEGVAHMQAQLSLKRTDFGVGQGQWSDGAAIGEVVKLDIAVAARR